MSAAIMRPEPALEPREAAEPEEFQTFVAGVLARLPQNVAGAIEDLIYMEDDAVMKALRDDWAEAKQKGAEQ